LPLNVYSTRITAGRKAATSMATSYDHCSITGRGVELVHGREVWTYYVDYNNNLTRIPKASVEWFKQVLAQKTLGIAHTMHDQHLFSFGSRYSEEALSRQPPAPPWQH